MFKNARYWEARAKEAEAELELCKAAIATAREELAGIQARFASRAALVSITRQGRLNHFLFIRNGQLIRVDTYSTMEDNLPGWKRDLLEGNSNGD